MSDNPRLPVLIGTGQISQRSDRGEASLEPADLMAEACRRAIADASPDPQGGKLLEAIESVRVVKALGAYPDTPGLVAERLGIAGVERAESQVGGNAPQSLLAASADEILAGERDTILLTGGEAWYSRSLAKREGRELGWTQQADDAAPERVIGADLDMFHPAELEREITMPIEVYALFENAVRARAGRSIEEHQRFLGELYASFSRVASQNPYAWDAQAYSAAEIATPKLPGNRLVGFPYTKLMNSNERVDQGAALLLCSVERAETLGIPRDRWVFPQTISEASALFMSERPELGRSVAAELAAADLWSTSGLRPDDVSQVDIYSCFPSAVQIQALALGIDLKRELTVTGGMRFAGGPWNNYTMHALATLVTRLREKPGEVGLCASNGGFISKLCFGLYSSKAPRKGYQHTKTAEAASSAREIDRTAKGPATIETYTVMHDSKGQAVRGVLACLRPDGRRAWATTMEPDAAAALLDSDPIGRSVELLGDGAYRFSA